MRSAGTPRFNGLCASEPTAAPPATQHGRMKPTFNSLPKIYSEWSSTSWAMLLGHAPPPVTSLNAGTVQTVGERAWEGEGGSLESPKRLPAKAAIRRAPATQRRASARAKSARRKQAVR
jgi:hypothetical protein